MKRDRSLQGKHHRTRVRWHRSLFGRIAIGFFLAITAVLAVQAIVTVRLADANHQASNAERITGGQALDRELAVHLLMTVH